MLLKIIIATFVILFPMFAFAQDEQFDWLIGKWRMDSNKFESYEEWQKTDGRISGQSYRMRNGQKVVTEYLFIEKFADLWTYIAAPKGQTITLFALVSSTNNEFIFENKEHDFPQQIIYAIDSDKTIKATVKGEKMGQEKRFSFTLFHEDKKTDKSEQKETIMNDTTPKVTGIGGIFFRSKNPKEIREWYGKNLGLAIDDFGSPFEFRNANKPKEINYLRWSPFDEASDYFAPSEKEFMINYRVQNLEDLVKKLRENGVNIVDDIEEFEYGKFVHIMDPEGNKIELWEPVDSFFTKMGGVTTK
jgi:predicted enzyme related to lactoylglutathione lyase